MNRNLGTLFCLTKQLSNPNYLPVYMKVIYFGFIRPILEYGSVVWDNCTREQSDLIESVQYESARIVTGLRKGTSRVKLYGELGWDSL